MTGTLVVVALDAADHLLAREWDCRNVLLDNDGDLETFVYGGTVPTTVEVWPTVATGLSPADHGVVANETAQDWAHPLLRLASSVTEHLPDRVRTELGRPFSRAGVRKQFRRTDAEHAFRDGYVYGWPGITDAEHLADAWNLMFRTGDDELTEPEFEARLFENTGAELAWTVRMAATDAPIVGVHCHVLDIAGHAYARQEDRLRAVYERVDSLLGWVRSEVDRMVVLSDHGMQVAWTGDDEPGTHSMRALFATTEAGDLPASVYDVRDWLEARTADGRAEEATLDSDAPLDRLEALGYR